MLAAALAGVTGCVEAVPGLPLSAPARGAAPYEVVVVAPQAAPAPQGAGGAVDAAVEQSGTLVVEGWAPAEHGQLLLVTSGAPDVVTQRRLRRPDAAAALGDPAHEDLGFRLVLRGASPGDGDCLLFRRSPQEAAVVLMRPGGAGCPA